MHRPTALLALSPLLWIAFTLTAQPANAEVALVTAETTFDGATNTEQGVRFSFDMGTERVNWNHSRFATADLPDGADLSEHQGLRVEVTTDQPREDVGVFIFLGESDGSWYVHPWAVDLTRESNAATVRLEHFQPAHWISPAQYGKFFDENDRLDLDEVDAIGFGTVNPLGVGEVAFTVTSAAAVRFAQPAPEPVNITVSGRGLNVHETTMIPAEVFGSFNLKSKQVDGESMSRATYYRLAMDRKIYHGGYADSPDYGNEITHTVLTSIGDRVHASKRLTDADWEEKYTRTGRSLGEKAKADGRVAWVEFWNEPYLNWANQNRRNFDPNFYDRSRAKEGGPVHLKMDGELMPHLRWTKDRSAPPWNWTENLQQWRRGKDANGNWTMPFAMPYHGWNPPKWRAEAERLNPPDDVEDGEKYEAANGKTYTAFTPWHVYDETQFTYWSGKGMLKPYIEPAKAFGEAAKQAGGENVFYIVGWGNRPSEDFWAGFDQLYKPTLDALIHVADAYNDHDYGGGPTKMTANAEVMTAYGVTEHDKWLYNVNTEASISADPQAWGDQAGEGVSADLAKFRWFTAKALHALEYAPAKVKGIAFFGMGGPYWSDTGEGVAAEMLMNLRGRLIHVEESSHDLIVVAAVDGTDPQNPRPEKLGPGDELVVAVYNQGLHPRQMNLDVAPPTGTSFEQLTVRTSRIRDGKPAIDETNPSLDGRDAHRIRAAIEPGQLRVYTFDLAGEPTFPDPVVRRQYFLDGILHEVAGNQPVEGVIRIDSDALKQADQAKVRFVAENLRGDEGVVEINGQAYDLPAAVTAVNEPALRELTIDRAILKPTNRVVFRTSQPHHAGYLLGTASIILDSE